MNESFRIFKFVYVYRIESKVIFLNIQQLVRYTLSFIQTVSVNTDESRSNDELQLTTPKDSQGTANQSANHSLSWHQARFSSIHTLEFVYCGYTIVSPVGYVLLLVTWILVILLLFNLHGKQPSFSLSLSLSLSLLHQSRDVSIPTSATSRSKLFHR